MNNKISPIIFSYFDSKLIHKANDYIQNTYNTEGVLYCTPQFAIEIVNSILNSFVSPKQEQIPEQKQEQERGWIGKYEGIQVVSIPELYGSFAAILLPKIKIGDINNE